MAAKIWSHHPKCTNSQIRYAMMITAQDLSDGSSQGGWGCDQKFGYGLVQAKAALDFLDDHPCDVNHDAWQIDRSNLGGCNTVPARMLKRKR